MFDSLFPDAADTALTTRAQRVDPAPPTPWFKDFWSATGKAIPRAGAEMARTGTALLTPEAVGAVSAPTMFSAPADKPKQQLADEIREQDRATAAAIKEFTPDPESTGAASMILHDVTRFVGKAAAYGAMGGTVPAIAGMTVDEGTNETLRRMDEGVDAATAVKLGVTKGIASGVAVALPVAGGSIPATLGLAAVGGPGSYIAEQATAKQILSSAGYDEKAGQINPFDPMGLGVSFLGSLLFGAGAHALRGVHAKAEARAADDRMMADPRPPGEQTQVAQSVARAYTPEQIDAAHVSVLQHQRESSALHARDDLAAAGKHGEALDRASEQLAAGQRVSVADVAPVDGLRMVAEIRPVVERANAVLRREAPAFPEVSDGVAIRDLPESVRQDLGTAIYTRDAYTTDMPYTDGWLATGREWDDFLESKIVEVLDTIPGLRLRPEPVNPLQINDTGRLVSEPVVKQYQQMLKSSEAPPILIRRDESGAAHIVEGGHRLQAAKREGAGQIKAVDITDLLAMKPEHLFARRAPAPEQQITDAVTGAAKAIQDAIAPKPEAAAPAKPAEPAAAHLEAEVARIEAMDPDMPVMLEGMDEPRPMREVMAEIKALADQEIADAPLIEVAAACALRG